MAVYVDANILKAHAEAHEASDEFIWQELARAASRIMDQAANVEPDFFADTSQAAAAERAFYGNGTMYLDLLPYHAGSITQVADKDSRVIPAADYREKDGFLIFDYVIGELIETKVTAKWGYLGVPDDVQMAVTEQALFMWRRRDLSFTEMSGVAQTAIEAPFSPTMDFVARKYRARYDTHFA